MTSMGVGERTIMLPLLLVALVCLGLSFIWWQRWDSRNASPSSLSTLSSSTSSSSAAPAQPCISYAVKLPEFSGDNVSVDEWLSKIDAVQHANGWSDDKLLQMLPTSLSARALLSFQKAEGKPVYEVLNDIALACRLSPEESLGVFFATRWNSQETFEQYALRIETALNSSPLRTADNMTRETLLRQRFVEGLPLNFKRVFDVTVCTSLRQAVQLANAANRREAADVRGHNYDATRQQRTTQSTVPFGSPPQRPFQPAQDRQESFRFSGECYRCGEKGHRARECTSSPPGNFSGLLKSRVQSTNQGPAASN